MHLGADGLDGNIEPTGGLGHAAFFGHHPKVMQVPIVEMLCHAFYPLFNRVSLQIIG
jgi:hypothetical protein